LGHDPERVRPEWVYGSLCPRRANQVASGDNSGRIQPAGFVCYVREVVRLPRRDRQRPGKVETAACQGLSGTNAVLEVESAMNRRGFLFAVLSFIGIAIPGTTGGSDMATTMGYDITNMKDFAGAKNYVPILCLDFDGVLHSYTSGWKGARNIPDPPVEGAMAFLVESINHFQVCIYSSRSRYWGGRKAMKRWLYKQFRELCATWETAPKYMRNMIAETAFADPWEYEVHCAAKRFIGKIKFPLMKPAAFLQIDDRAITFTGTFPTSEELLRFVPWNKKKEAANGR